MLGISYGELFLLLGATAALIGPKDLPIVARTVGPKDLPIVARTVGRLAGRAIGYVQLARGQFDSVMQQTQARQVHKELQDTMAQLEAIRYEIRSISFMNPGPVTRRLVDDLDHGPVSNGNKVSEKLNGENRSTVSTSKDNSSAISNSCDMHIQAVAYAKLAESLTLKTGSVECDKQVEVSNESDLTILPLSAESAGMLPKCNDDVKGSDIVLEAIIEAEVARNAKDFFAQPQNQIKYE